MQGAHLHINMNRALQRMAGTVAGACIAWLILAQDPSVWTVIAGIVVFQFITEAVIGYNYAFGQITVTLLALLMSHLAASGVSPAGMAPERVFDTIVGAPRSARCWRSPAPAWTTACTTPTIGRCGAPCAGRAPPKRGT